MYLRQVLEIFGFGELRCVFIAHGTVLYRHFHTSIYGTLSTHSPCLLIPPFSALPTLVSFVLQFSFVSTLMSCMHISCVELKSRNHKRERMCWMYFGDWLKSFTVTLSSGTCFPADGISSFFLTAGRWHVHHMSSYHPSAFGRLDRLHDGCVQCCSEHCDVCLSCVDLRTFG